MNLEDFADASDLLRGGIYVLLLRGRAVYIGRSSGPMLAKIAALRTTDRPRFLPRIVFDQVLIRHIHPDQINSVYFALLAEHQPKHNAPAAAPPSTIHIERRV